MIRSVSPPGSGNRRVIGHRANLDLAHMNSQGIAGDTSLTCKISPAIGGRTAESSRVRTAIVVPQVSTNSTSDAPSSSYLCTIVPTSPTTRPCSTFDSFRTTRSNVSHLESILLDQAGYAVTKHGLSERASTIQTVRIRTPEPDGVDTLPSTTYLAP